MIDFTENIDSLESMVWNFILNSENNIDDVKPQNHSSLPKEDLITLILPKYFNNEIRQETYKYSLKFFKEYNKIPNKKELKSYIELNNYFLEDNEIEELYLFNLKEYSYDYLYQYIKSFIMLRNLNMTMFDILAYLKTSEVNPNNIDGITEKIRNDINSKLSVNFSSNSNGLSFFNPHSHIQIPKMGTPTGFDFFDRTLGGGWNLKTLVVLQGRPKVGKSTVLGNIAARSFLTGNNTGVVTVELADRSYMKRLGSNILSVDKDEYEKINDEESTLLIEKKIDELKSSGKELGYLEVVEFPTGGATAIDIENYFIRLESRINKKFKVIVVDYINLLRPVGNKEGLYEKVKQICEELRGVAMRNEWCIISATQIRREDVGNFDLGMDSVAESFGLVHTVDSLFGLMRSPLEGRMKIKVIANRDNGYEERYKFYTMETKYFRLTEEVGMNSEYYSDDDAGGHLQDEVREEYKSLESTDITLEEVHAKSNGSINIKTSNYSDDEYDELLKNI